MTFQKQIVGSLLAGLCLSTLGCVSSGPVDASNPTVAELDRLDVQWGLEPRKAKGAPKRMFQYQADDTSGAPPATAATMIEPSPSPAPEPEPPVPPPPAEPQLDPSLINKLR